MKTHSSCPVLEVGRTQSYQKNKNLFVGVSSQNFSKKRATQEEMSFFQSSDILFDTSETACASSKHNRLQ